MSHRRAWLVLTTSTAAVTALLFTGCAGPAGPASHTGNVPPSSPAAGENPDGKLTEADSPLLAYRNLAYPDGAPPNASEQERWRIQAQQQNRMDELIAACMAKEGFEYSFHRLNEDSPPPAEDWKPEDREWVSRYGYGLQNYPGRLPPNAEPDQIDEERPAMSEAEEAAYQVALFGSEPAEGEPYDPAKAGCQGAAEYEVLGYQAWRHPESQQIIDAIMSFPMEIGSHPDFASLEAEWAVCMAERGYPEFKAQRETQASIEELRNDYFPADDGSDDPRTKDPRFATLDDPAYAEIHQQEVTLALADLDCREQTDYRQRYLRTKFALEERFIADHAEELAALKARVEQGG